LTQRITKVDQNSDHPKRKNLSHLGDKLIPFEMTARGLQLDLNRQDITKTKLKFEPKQNKL
jgi:hypothetical protein